MNSTRLLQSCSTKINKWTRNYNPQDSNSTRKHKYSTYSIANLNRNSKILTKSTIKTSSHYRTNSPPWASNSPSPSSVIETHKTYLKPNSTDQIFRIPKRHLKELRKRLRLRTRRLTNLSLTFTFCKKPYSNSGRNNPQLIHSTTKTKPSRLNTPNWKYKPRKK